MSGAIACSECTSISNFQGIGFGPDFIGLKKYYDSVVGELKKTETLGSLNEALRSLDDVFIECSKEGWDGYDAQPITETAYIEAKRFIESMPLISFLPSPEIIPEPNGEIGLEWSKGKRQIFIASLRGENEIVYAGLFGTNKTHGTEYFWDTVPSTIIENLKRLYF